VQIQNVRFRLQLCTGVELSDTNLGGGGVDNENMDLRRRKGESQSVTERIVSCMFWTIQGRLAVVGRN